MLLLDVRRLYACAVQIVGDATYAISVANDDRTAGKREKAVSAFFFSDSFSIPSFDDLRRR